MVPTELSLNARVGCTALATGQAATDGRTQWGGSALIRDDHNNIHRVTTPYMVREDGRSHARRSFAPGCRQLCPRSEQWRVLQVFFLKIYITLSFLSLPSSFPLRFSFSRSPPLPLPSGLGRTPPMGWNTWCTDGRWVALGCSPAPAIISLD